MKYILSNGSEFTVRKVRPVPIKDVKKSTLEAVHKYNETVENELANYGVEVLYYVVPVESSNPNLTRHCIRHSGGTPFHFDSYGGNGRLICNKFRVRRSKYKFGMPVLRMPNGETFLLECPRASMPSYEKELADYKDEYIDVKRQQNTWWMTHFDTDTMRPTLKYRKNGNGLCIHGLPYDKQITGMVQSVVKIHTHHNYRRSAITSPTIKEKRHE